MTPTSNEIKHRLRRQGKTLKDFARENGFAYRTELRLSLTLRLESVGSK